MTENSICGFMLGLLVGFLIMSCVLWACLPVGYKSVAKDCIKVGDKPNICRTITTYTTPYAEER